MNRRHTSRMHRKHWTASMAELTDCPNVSVKLGGTMMRLAAYDYYVVPMPPTSSELADMWGPYIRTRIELFSADRTMFESNFPVDKMRISYKVLWNTFKRIVAGASDDEKRAFCENAKRIYRIDDGLASASMRPDEIAGDVGAVAETVMERQSLKAGHR